MKRRFTIVATVLALGLAWSGAPDKPTASARPVKRTAELSLPAIFSQYVAPPGKANHIKEPGRIVFAPEFQELYVVDPGNNRILIFDSNMVFRFEFYAGEHMSMPMDMAVTGEGYIYVLGSSPSGRNLVKFDFDGEFLATYDLANLLGGNASAISSLAAGSDGTVYLLDQVSHQILSLDTTGKFSKRIPVARFLPEKERNELVYGSISIYGDLIYVPLSMTGMVAVYTTAGEFVRTIGSKGSATGDLAFPIAVAVNRDGVVHILDKERFNVVCYSQDGKFIGEFGGMGEGPGWFYGPERIAVNNRNEIIVGQVMNNVIQVCKPVAFLIPDQASSK